MSKGKKWSRGEKKTYSLSFEVFKFGGRIRNRSDQFQRLLMSLKSVETVCLLKDSPVFGKKGSRANKLE